jgi:hypothetical protein
MTTYNHIDRVIDGMTDAELRTEIKNRENCTLPDGRVFKEITFTESLQFWNGTSIDTDKIPCAEYRRFKLALDNRERGIALMRSRDQDGKMVYSRAPPKEYRYVIGKRTHLLDEDVENDIIRDLVADIRRDDDRQLFVKDEVALKAAQRDYNERLAELRHSWDKDTRYEELKRELERDLYQRKTKAVKKIRFSEITTQMTDKWDSFAKDMWALGQQKKDALVYMAKKAELEDRRQRALVDGSVAHCDDCSDGDCLLHVPLPEPMDTEQTVEMEVA